MARVKARDLNVGDIIYIYQENVSCKIDCEITHVLPVERPNKWANDKQFFMICFEDKYTEGQTLTDIVLREDREVILVTLEDRVNGCFNYLLNSHGYTERELINELSKGDGTSASNLAILEEILGQVQGDAWEVLGEQRRGC